MYRKIYVVETQHHDPKIGWVVVASYSWRNSAWQRMRACRISWPGEKFRTVPYTPTPSIDDCPNCGGSAPA